ncbi:hypothetical protein PF005_g12722 [Phytophthora fragariae]|uniref:Uncharacterized protein n=2 Tax=Phytophthora fragariae TaxID=53985 RepID=A0A6A3XTN4_9STRA|nr:hypothetical protein PF003_g6394 [Phytophthora fragariae]KAE8936624.1 hypothetical protein PF009_g13449 [Phytophthora fragariae]KAE9122928.1 hypothetical protein PF007_g7256 [Phytophthora fragariae]KAE9142858.1 hypothetical protein PF006_g12072 [Phytophthora fragariae]KAE9207179.1 hypothetical protein PF005_g12722 [Phytophthora fragariae]
MGSLCSNGEIQRKHGHGFIRQSTVSRAKVARHELSGHDDNDRDPDGPPLTPSGLLALLRVTPMRSLQAIQSKSRRRPLPRSTRAIRAETEGASTSQKPAKDPKDANEATKTPASEKPTNGSEAGRQPPASKNRAATAATKNTTSASSKLTRKTKEATASSKPAPKKAVVKKPATKQLPKKKSAAKEGRRTAWLPPTRTDVLLPGSHEAVSSESSDTDTPNHGIVTDDGAFTSHDGPAPRASASPQPHTAMANFVTAQPQERSPSPDLSLQLDYEE